MRIRNAAIGATALLVTAPLVWFGLAPIYIVQILIQPTAEIEAQVLAKEVLTQQGSGGVVFFDFAARLKDSAIERVVLEIRPEAERTFYRQGDGYRVDDGVATGVAQLGSPEWPLKRDERYTFRLVVPPNRSILDGKIIAKVHPVAGGSPALVVAIGVLASVLQVLSVFAPRPTRSV